MKEIKIELKKLMTEDRYKHTLEVMKTAKKLAKHYKISSKKAKLAALLHDCAKNFTIEDMYRLLGNRINGIEKQYRNKAMLHSFAGAIYARNIFKIEDKDILNAIRYHTTGRENMSFLEKIVYISDVIEPTRKCCNLEKLRKIVYKDINKAILMESENKIKFLMDKRMPIHPDTISMRNNILLKVR